MPWGREGFAPCECGRWNQPNVISSSYPKVSHGAPAGDARGESVEIRKKVGSSDPTCRGTRLVHL